MLLGITFPQQEPAPEHDFNRLEIILVGFLGETMALGQNISII
jgi:hypothetical protein